jgi:BlaI family transcriptional regulator, penicillinase repressor
VVSRLERDAEASSAATPETFSTPVKINVDTFTSVENAAFVMAKTEIELTEAEWTIIKAVWESEPCTAPAIQEKLHKQTEWTYSTVRTVMDRMVAKGLLESKKSGKLTLYRSAVTRAQAQRGELLYALKNAFDDALQPMMQCLLDSKNLSRKELDQLKQLIAEHETDRGKEGRKS